MSNTRNIKTDIIESNSTNNIELRGTGEFQLESGAFPNIAQDEVMIRDSSDRIRSSGVPISSVTKNVVDTVDPTTEGSNDGYSVGSRWFNSTNDILWILVSDTSTPADVADFMGQVAGMTTDVTIEADNAGTTGNSISLSFDGIDDISTVLAAWNLANPGNTATAIAGDFGQVPDNLEVINLSGGVNAVDGGTWEQVAGFSITQDTLANIIAASRVAGAIYLSTDTGDFLSDDGTTLTSMNILKDTFANLDALTKFAGRIVYATDQNTYYGDNGTALIPIGSGGGGVDVYVNENFEVTSASDFTTGNGVGLSGGTLQGTLTDETTSPIEGDQSISYVQAAGSLNDFFFLPTETVGTRQQSKQNQSIVFCEYDGNDDDIQYIIYDDTNSTVLGTGFVKASTETQRINIAGDFPDDIVSLKLGFRVIVENIGAELIFDLVEGSTKPFNPAVTGVENTFSGKFDGSAAASVSVVTESGSGVFTVSQLATGRFQINYSSLGLTVAPSCVASIEGNVGTDGMRVINVGTTTADIEMLNSGGAYTNYDFRAFIQKQGADYQKQANVAQGVTNETVSTGLTGGTVVCTLAWYKFNGFIFVQGHVDFSGGVFTGGTFTFNLPSGETIDTSQFPVSPTTGRTKLGDAIYVDASNATAGDYRASVMYDTTTTVLLRTDITTGGNVFCTGFTSTTTSPFTWVSADSINFNYSVPVL